MARSHDMLAASTERIKYLEAELKKNGDLWLNQINALLAHCPIPECAYCAVVVCPHKCSMHFHHDGCPACAESGD